MLRVRPKPFVFAAFGVVLVVAGILAIVWLRGAVARRSGGPALSVFEPHAGGCAWSKVDRLLSGDPRSTTIERFPADCAGVEVAWSADGTQGLVWFQPEGGAPQDGMLYAVDVPHGRSRRLPVPESGDPERFVFARDGRILTFTKDLQDADDAPLRALKLDGERWVETADAAGLAASLRADATMWRRQSLVLLSESEAYARLRSAKLQDALRESGDDAGPFLAMKRSGWPRALIFRAVGDGAPRATGKARFARFETSEAVPELGFGERDVIRPMSEGPLLLIAEWATGNAPHLYDARTGALLYKSKVATDAVFWPANPAP